MAIRELWDAESGKIQISGTLFSAGLIGSDFTAIVKDISITGGGRDVDGVPCFGSGSNYYLFEKRTEMIEASITTVKQNNFLGKAILGSAATSEYPVLLAGDALRDPVNVLYTWIDRYNVSGAEMRIKLGTAYCTGKEMSLSVDDHVEETFTFKCKPENYQEDYTAYRVGSACTLTL